jgi:GMP synthase (glutamine-hydrolysing)
VVETFKQVGLGDNLHIVDASKTFLKELEGTTDPEQKRLIIGKTFVDVAQEQARQLGIEKHLLGQGTIYPDTIEAGGTKRSDTIKTHHNRVPMIDEMIERGELIEPLANLYKVEVRELGAKLGVPTSSIARHPFPGPGLGVRLLCSDGVPDMTGFDEIEVRLEELSKSSGLEMLPLPIRSVGVKADLRAYEHPVLLSGDESWSRIIDTVSTITAEVPGINRCIWNLGPEHPKDAYPVAATVTRERLDLLREADYLVMDALERFGWYDEIWQCPTVLVPLRLEDTSGETIVIRPVRSQRAMTATPVQLPKEMLVELSESILSLEGVGGLALDVTSKPPGTIEWE